SELHHIYIKYEYKETGNKFDFITKNDYPPVNHSTLILKIVGLLNYFLNGLNWRLLSTKFQKNRNQLIINI
ncbi:MAG: hypothetical protein K8R85_12775, partial [Bacteroidetes bacterium]|nr:hypothetical protein [Bacteroidota bacterium]